MQLFSDYHTHTYFSSDSTSSPESMVKRAIELGLPSICFTDHNDFDYRDEDGKTIFLLDLNQYMKEMESLREQYASKIPIYIGVEQGLQPYLAEKINHYGCNYDFDYIIGSSHTVNGIDPYYPNYWEGITDAQGILNYFKSIVENIQVCNRYDVYGHLDYIVRYAPTKDNNYTYNDFSDILDVILKSLIEQGKGIEINTAGFKYGLKEANPCLDILKRYKELGGEILTIGSDGHKPEHLAYAFDKIYNIVKAANFKYYTVFKHRNPEFIRID